MKKHIPLLLITVAISLFFFRCTSNIEFVTSQYDQAKKEKRIRLRITFPYVQDRYTTFYSAQKDFLKIIKANGESRYQVFDQLNMSKNSYPLSDTIFLIANDKAYPIVVRDRKTEIFHQTKIKKDEISKGDSVITAVNEKEYKNVQFNYTLNRQEIEALQHADSASFQYYANPEVYKLKLSYYSLKRLKKFFTMK